MPQVVRPSQVSPYALPIGEARAPSPLRRKRAIFLAITAVMIATVIAGFWPYFRDIGRSDVARPWVIHLHGLVFSGWMVLLLTQVLLVLRRRTDLHRRLGRAGIAYGVLVLLLGLVASIVAPLAHVAAGEWTLDQAASFLILPLGDMVLFGSLFAAGIAYRRQPDIHKRLMLLATIALMFAPAARLAGDDSLPRVFGIWIVPLIIAIADDLWTRRRIHVTYVVGTAVLVIGFARVFFMESPGWLNVGRAVLIAFGAEPTR